MAKPKKSPVTPGRSEQATAVADQMGEIMCHFNEARSLVIVCQRSLESLELAGDETEVLLVAVELLRRTYNELDAFASRCFKSSRAT